MKFFLLSGIVASLCTISGITQADYKCKVEYAFNPAGNLVMYAEPSYWVNKEFSVNRRTGIMSGALSNSFTTMPKIIDLALSGENSYKVVNYLSNAKTGQGGSNIWSLVIGEYLEGREKPFVFTWDLDVFTGNCVRF
jgi:hypothetical protein